MAPDKRFMTWEGPLMAALTSISIASFVAFFFPGSAFAYGVDRASLYGGLLIFSGLFMASTQRLMDEAEKQSDKDFDAINSSLNVYLDGLNIFIRIVRTLLENDKSESKP
jgi:FtsH-binding integral membrane protein